MYLRFIFYWIRDWSIKNNNIWKYKLYFFTNILLYFQGKMMGLYKTSVISNAVLNVAFLWELISWYKIDEAGQCEVHLLHQNHQMAWREVTAEVWFIPFSIILNICLDYVINWLQTNKIGFQYFCFVLFFQFY